MRNILVLGITVVTVSGRNFLFETKYLHGVYTMEEVGKTVAEG